MLLVLVVLSKSLSAQTLSPFYEDGNIYIKIKSSAIAKYKHEVKDINDFDFLNGFVNTYTVASFQHLYAFAKHPGLENIYKISMAETSLIEQAIALINKIEEIEYAEKVPYKTYFATAPNDTSYNNTLQWNLFKINAQIAWNFIGNPAPSQAIVAIIDDGLDINHVDLKENIWVNNLELNGLPGIDDDGNFIIDDSLGYDFGNFDTDASPNDITWHHGTHVSGIAGAVTNNTTGIASISYNTRLMAVKGSSSNLFVSNGFEAIAYAADNGADVINLSWGAPVSSITEQNTIAYANYLGVVVVAAAGNSNDATVNYPAAYPHVISVASSSSNDTKANGTTYGQWIDVSAPGVSIFSTIPGNSFGTLSGTSMAAPLVAGLAALMRTYNPLLTPEQVEGCIKNNTDNIDFMNPNYPGKLGTGRINAFKAMQCVSATRNQVDASLKGFSMPNAFSCATTFIPKVALKNCGSANLSNVNINYSLDGIAFNTLHWTGDMAYDSLQYIALPAISVTSGQHNLLAYCSNPNGVLDWSFLNDTISSQFQLYNSGLALPFNEDFESGFANKAWRISNPDQDKTWQIKAGTIDGIANKAAFINMFNYANEGQRDGLITPPLNFSGYDSLNLQFDYAWQKNFRHLSDSLIIYASTDCGNSFPYRIAAYGHDSLALFATVIDTMDNYFNPTLSSSWCGNIINCIDLDLTMLAGNSSVLLKFETFNNFNNNLFIDNINVTGSSLAISTPAGNSITASSASICQGDVITFTANDPNNNVTSWNWSFANGNPSTANGQSVTIQFNSAGSVNAALTVANNIGNANVSLTNPIVVHAIPAVNILQNDTVICVDNSITINVNGANNYFWSPAYGLSDTTGAVVIALPQQPITYTVMGVSTDGCINYDTISIDTTVCLALFSSTLESNFKVYYNASTGFIMLKVAELDLRNQSMSLFNALGQLIDQIVINQNAGSVKPIIDCSSFSNGIYFATISSNNKKIATQKVMIHKQ